MFRLKKNTINLFKERHDVHLGANLSKMLHINILDSNLKQSQCIDDMAKTNNRCICLFVRNKIYILKAENRGTVYFLLYQVVSNERLLCRCKGSNILVSSTNKIYVRTTQN